MVLITEVSSIRDRTTAINNQIYAIQSENFLCFYKKNIIIFHILGVLACLDGYMNIALDQTEEYANGQLKNKYGDAFIRGNNVLYISTQKRRV